MERNDVQRVNDCVSLIASDDSEPISAEMQGEFALVAAKYAMKRGAFDEAIVLIETVAKTVVDAAVKRDVAALLLSLARVWTRQQEHTRADWAIRTALELDPVQVRPIHALRLQRQEFLPEAIAEWREAIRQEPGEASHYLHLAKAYEQIGEPPRALETYLELASNAPSAQSYLVVAQRLNALASQLPQTPAHRRVRIALLGNATLDHLHSYLTVECFRAAVHPTIYQSGFDQYTQDILDPLSSLHSFAPEVVICAVHASRLFPQIHNYPFDMTPTERHAEMEAGLQTLQHLLDVLTERTSALVLVHGMVAPQFPVLGILDWRNELGQTEMFQEINSRLATMVRSHYKNVFIVDEDRIQSRTGKAEAADPRLWLTSRIAWSDAVLRGLAKEYLRYIRALKGLNRKCIILDLDNTLWGGVVGEDGLAGLKLSPDAPGNGFLAFQRELVRLWRRGVLLAIASKNNEEDVLPVFERHPDMALTLGQFAARRINWIAKVDNIRDIARELNIGLDSIVFFDDNPVERARVRAELPEVLTPELPIDPAYYRQTLLELGVFETLALTIEDRRRNQMYAEQRTRHEFEASYNHAGTSLTDYLTDLRMVVEIEPLHAQTLPRIAQLTNKTNQFNLTTQRYSEAQIEAMAAAGAEIYSARVMDRFGDNGLVGVIIMTLRDGETLEIDTLLLSCRIMGRGVETALLAFLTERARQSRRRVQGWYLPTAKNGPAKDCYSEHGFILIERQHDGSELWQLDLSTTTIDCPQWLAVRHGETAA